MKYTNKDIKIMLGIADTHFPFQSKTTLDIILQISSDIKPHYIVHLGDAIDCAGISKYTAKGVADGLVATLKEIDMFQRFLGDLKSTSKRIERIQYFKGNHSQRINDTLEKMEQRGELESYDYWKEQLDFNKLFPGIDWYEYNEVKPLGQTNSKLFGTHGEFCGANHPKKHLEVYGCNLLYGHLHTHATYCAVTKGDGMPKEAISMPCSCIINPAYMKNKASSWVNGLAVIYLFPNGTYNTNIIKIINNKTIFNGKVYEA